MSAHVHTSSVSFLKTVGLSLQTADGRTALRSSRTAAARKRTRHGSSSGGSGTIPALHGMHVARPRPVRAADNRLPER